MISGSRLVAPRAALLLGAAVIVSCASGPKSPAPEIRTGGDSKSLNALVGRWEGTYTNTDNGRKGSIVLDFFSGGTVAHGDILMTPPTSKAAPASDEETLKTMPRVFEINFIDAGPGGKVSGTVGPYEEIGLDCGLQTEFTGTLAGDGMAGTFRTECVAGSSLVGRPTTGIWSVARKK